MLETIGDGPFCPTYCFTGGTIRDRPLLSLVVNGIVICAIPYIKLKENICPCRIILFNVVFYFGIIKLFLANYSNENKFILRGIR